MDAIMDLLDSVVPDGFAIEAFLKAVLALVIGIFLISFVGRLFFGKKSVLNRSVSSAINILFIYVVTVVIYSFGIDLGFLISPLPFVSISGSYMTVFNFAGAHYTTISDQILSMVILAFLANLADSWLPEGKKLFGWFFFRCLSVLVAMLLHLIVNAVITALLPEGFLVWAPVVLLGLLALLLLLGALKGLVGLVIASVNPLIGGLYTFFFATAVGKQLSKALLTTVILSGVVYVLNYFGFTVIYIASSALAAYIPLLIVLLVIWYIIGHLL